MCAIVGSFNKDKLIELIELNSYRGSHSFSFSTYDKYTNVLNIHAKYYGTIPYDIIEIFKDEYGIVHIQAPTTDATSTDNIHPSRIRKHQSYLWHNGIIKAEYVKKLQERFGNDTEWDTELLHRSIDDNIDNLNDVDGSFSCLWYHGSKLLLFRNDISPMFIDNEMNISSTKFPGSYTTESNQVIHLDLANNTTYNVRSFNTVNNPYFFGAV
jgi:glutamine phosphoribosylpyrophosphate amidotransferase